MATHFLKVFIYFHMNTLLQARNYSRINLISIKASLKCFFFFFFFFFFGESVDNYHRFYRWHFMRPYHKQLISKLAKMCISRSLLFWLISFQDNRSYVQLENLTHLTSHTPHHMGQCFYHYSLYTK